MRNSVTGGISTDAWTVAASNVVQWSALGCEATIGLSPDNRIMYAYLKRSGSAAEAHWLDYDKSSRRFDVGLVEPGAETYLSCEIQR